SGGTERQEISVVVIDQHVHIAGGAPKDDAPRVRVRQLGVDGGGDEGLVPLEAEEDHRLSARLSDVNPLQRVSTRAFLKVMGTQHKWFAIAVEIAAARSPYPGLTVS